MLEFMGVILLRMRHRKEENERAASEVERLFWAFTIGLGLMIIGVLIFGYLHGEL
jgi:hypothetical protein